MKKSFKYIFLLIATFAVNTSFGQDVHFSQMIYSPTNLNPALSGANTTLQVITNYRSQWKSVAVPYQTFGASVDGRFNNNKRGKKGIMAGGIGFFNDQVGDLKVTTNNVTANLAYHLILDRTSTLGLGIYGGWGQRTINSEDGRWGNQYDGMNYDEALPSNEVFNSPSFSYLDAGAGLVYTYRQFEGYMTQNNQKEVTGGVAFYHVNNPSFSFIDNGSEKLYMRWSMFVNALIGFENSDAALEPAIYFNRQKSTMEILYGTYYRFMLTEGSKITGFNKPFYFHLGLFHRWGDALIAKSMIEWNQYSAGFAYDFNISSLNEVSSAKGGFEIFLRYNLIQGPGTMSKIR